MSADDNLDLDVELADAYNALAADLAGALDLAVGLAAAVDDATYNALTGDLAAALDVAGGLAAIIGERRTPAHHTVWPAPDQAASTLQSAFALSDVKRLVLRSSPEFRTLKNVLAQILELAIAYVYMLDVIDLVDRLLDRLGEGRTGTTGAGEDRTSGGTVLGLLDAAASAAETVRTAVISAHRLSESFSDDLSRLVRAVERLDTGVTDLDLARGDATDIQQKLIGELERVTERASALAHSLGFSLTESGLRDGPAILPAPGEHSRWRKNAQFLRVRDWTVRVGDEFSGANLIGADMVVDPDLQGVRWSSATVWPPAWRDRIRDSSVEMLPGIFQITGGRETSRHQRD